MIKRDSQETFLLLLWKGLLTSWDRRKVVSWLESGSVVLLIPPLFINACLKTFLCFDVCEDWCFCITWRVSQWLSIRRWCCLHLCPPSFSPSSRFSLRTLSPFKPFRAFPCAAESSYHCLWNQQVPRTCSTSILLCALVCPWLPEGHAALKQEPQLPRTALEMQWNELLQLIAFSLTQSPAWGLSSDMQSKLVDGKSVARSWWAHTCFVKNRPGWWPLGMRARAWCAQHLPLGGPCKLVLRLLGPQPKAWQSSSPGFPSASWEQTCASATGEGAWPAGSSPSLGLSVLVVSVMGASRNRSFLQSSVPVRCVLLAPPPT